MVETKKFGADGSFTEVGNNRATIETKDLSKKLEKLDPGQYIIVKVTSGEHVMEFNSYLYSYNPGPVSNSDITNNFGTRYGFSVVELDEREKGLAVFRRSEERVTYDQNFGQTINKARSVMNSKMEGGMAA